MKKILSKIIKPKIKFMKGTRAISFLFITSSFLIAAGILWGANMYFNIDTGEVIVEEVQRITGILRATAGLIVGGSATQNPSTGYVFESVGSSKLATTTISNGTLELIDANQVLRFTGGTSFSVGFKAPATLSTTTVYTLPQSYPPASGYVLQSTTNGVLSWLDLGAAGLGDITGVGDVASGEAFTSTGSGSSLWFHNSGFTGQLTVGTLTANRTYTLPNSSGTFALGTGQANYVAYWTSTNTLGAEQYLSVSRGGTGAGSFTQYGLLYGNNTSALGVTPAGSTNQILLGNTGSAPSWGSVTTLLNAGTNITISATGTNQALIATVNNPVFSSSVTSPQFLSLGSLLIQSGGGSDITIDSASGKIVLGAGDYIVTNSGYEIGKAGTEILRQMIPIFGFDLPAQTATTSYVKISRTIDDYPFPPAATGTVRVHKFVVRYTDNLPLASSTNWRVATTTGSAFSSFNLPGRNDSSLANGLATTTQDVNIPTDGTDWWLEVKSQEPYDTYKIKVFQIFLAAYDKIL
jgi:hypothetical protein